MVISVKNLVRSFKIPKKVESQSLLGKVKNWVLPEQIRIQALKGISFKVKKGDLFGYLGPNGAGKSTTIKILTGIISPDSGEVDCLGYVPWKDRIKYTKNIGVVFGQRSLMWWDIPVMETFKLYRDIYEVPDREFKQRIDYYSDILDIGKLLNIPVRKLSLGERMKCEVASSLLHSPKIVFLDEPTIGLDAVARENIIRFIKDVNKKFKTTIFLTTHYMGDVEEVCKRIIVIDKGQKVYEGKLDKFKDKYVKEKEIELEVKRFIHKNEFKKILRDCKIIEKHGNYYRLSVPIKYHIPAVVSQIMESCELSDLNISEPKLEKIIAIMYKEMR